MNFRNFLVPSTGFSSSIIHMAIDRDRRFENYFTFGDLIKQDAGFGSSVAVFPWTSLQLSYILPWVHEPRTQLKYVA
jgi:hypothetical protein